LRSELLLHRLFLVKENGVRHLFRPKKNGVRHLFPFLMRARPASCLRDAGRPEGFEEETVRRHTCGFEAGPKIGKETCRAAEHVMGARTCPEREQILCGDAPDDVEIRT